MLSALKKLIASPPRDANRRSTSPTPLEKSPGTRKTDTGHKPAGVSPEEIDAAFYGLMLGVRSPIDSELNDFEKKVLRELDRLLASHAALGSRVPRLPEVIPRVMSALRDESSSAADVAAELGRDPVLVSEVIRLANSSYYRVGRKISSMERAVCVLGRVGVRQLVANAAFKPLINLNYGHFTRLSVTLLWEQSEKAAVISDCLARHQNLDRFHAYLVAIVANVGLTVALRILDHAFDGRQAPRSALFRERLVRRSRQLSRLVATEWGFPEVVLDALESQIDTETTQPLGNILYASDKLAKIHMLRARGHFEGDTPPFARRILERFPHASEVCGTTLSA